MSVALPVVRGCGTRKQGGIYWTVGLSPHGQPLEHFLVDPPIPVPASILVPARGVVLLAEPRDEGTRTVYHVVDRVGREYYPHVTDFLEEVRRFGLSRRLPKNFNYSLLTPESRIIMVHDHAYTNVYDHYIREYSWPCPQKLDGHPFPHQCAGFWWHDLDPDLVSHHDHRGRATREMPSFEYEAYLTPPDEDNPDERIATSYRMAFFASFPASRLEVVDGEGADKAMEAASAAQLPCALVDL